MESSIISTNSSLFPAPHWPGHSMSSETLYYSVQAAIAVVGMVANGLLIFSHIKDPLRCFRVPSSWFILNIALLDVTVSTLLLISATLILVQLHSDIQLTQTPTRLILKLWIIIAVGSCPMFLGLAIERFYSVVFPLRHRTQLTTRICLYCIGALWIMHCIFEVLVTTLFSPLKNIEFDSVSVVYFMVFFLSSQFLYMAALVLWRSNGEK